MRAAHGRDGAQRVRFPVLVLGCLALALAAGCQPPQPTTAPEGRPGESGFAGQGGGAIDPAQQLMGAFSFLAGTCMNLKGPGSTGNHDTTLQQFLNKGLSSQPLTQGWNLAWGPAVYQNPMDKGYDTNLMYVVRKSNSNNFVIAVRGTSQNSPYDIFDEDLNVSSQVAWTAGSTAMIAQGTDDGLTHLLAMTATAGGTPQTLSQYLLSQTASPIDLTVTGHSLGGVLAPTLALWLAENRSAWDTSGTSEISVYAFAGPTAGNSAFATHSNQRIGAKTYRIYNPLDVVPLAWDATTLGKIPDLYNTWNVTPNTKENQILGYIQGLPDSETYAQLPNGIALPAAFQPNPPPLPSKDGLSSYSAQLYWQHICGYHCALGLNPPALQPINLDCGTTFTAVCNCPSSSGSQRAGR